jgi:hypothetical protein
VPSRHDGESGRPDMAGWLTWRPGGSLAWQKRYLPPLPPRAPSPFVHGRRPAASSTALVRAISLAAVSGYRVSLAICAVSRAGPSKQSVLVICSCLPGKTRIGTSVTRAVGRGIDLDYPSPVAQDVSMAGCVDEGTMTDRAAIVLVLGLSPRAAAAAPKVTRNTRNYGEGHNLCLQNRLRVVIGDRCEPTSP